MVLEKGLKFVPPKRLNKFTTFIDIQKYVRKLNVQRYIIPNPIRSQNEVASHIVHSGLSNPSLLNPPGPIAPSIKVFRDLVLQDLDKLSMKKIYSDPNIKTGLKQLCERKDLTIRPADKGGGIVILDKNDYHLEMIRILSDTDTYSRIPNIPTSTFKKTLTNLIDTGFQLGILDKMERSYLIPVAPWIPVIYYLPKVHKSITQPPGRPIISGIDSITSRIRNYIDFYL